MKAGLLRNKIEVQAYTEARGDRGQAVKTWGTVATVPASIEPLAGRKLELARQLVATATHKVTIRYLSSLTIDNRLILGTRILNIGNVNNMMESNFTQELLCTEQSTGG